MKKKNLLIPALGMLLVPSTAYANDMFMAGVMMLIPAEAGVILLILLMRFYIVRKPDVKWLGYALLSFLFVTIVPLALIAGGSMAYLDEAFSIVSLWLGGLMVYCASGLYSLVACRAVAEKRGEMFKLSWLISGWLLLGAVSFIAGTIKGVE